MPVDSLRWTLWYALIDDDPSLETSIMNIFDIKNALNIQKTVVILYRNLVNLQEFIFSNSHIDHPAVDEHSEYG